MIRFRGEHRWEYARWGVIGNVCKVHRLGTFNGKRPEYWFEPKNARPPKKKKPMKVQRLSESANVSNFFDMPRINWGNAYNSY